MPRIAALLGALNRSSNIASATNPETWTPLNLPTLHAWWSMAGTGTIRTTSSGDGSGNLQTRINSASGSIFISQIDDLSGNGNHLQQTTEADQPEVIAQVNGLWTCDFDGVSDFLDVASPTDLAQSNSIIIAFRILSKVAGNPNMFIAGMATGFNNSISKHGTNDFYRFSAGTPTDTIMEVDLTEPRILIATFRPDTLSVAYMNTTQIIETPVDVGAQSFRAARIGAGTESDNFSNIRFLEAIVLDGSISAANRTDVVAYLQNKWGISNSLPGGGPGDKTFDVDLMPSWYHCSYRVKRDPYLSGVGIGAGGAELTLRYREAGTTTWIDGAGTLLPDATPGGAWFEPNAGFTWPVDSATTHAVRGTTYLVRGNADFLDEWRGHIIGLSPNKTYDLQITIDPGGGNETTTGVQFSTWPLPEDLQGTVITLNSSYTNGLKFSEIPNIGSGGAPNDWKIIEPASGGTTIQPNGGEYMLYADRPYVAFRPNGNDRFTLTRGTSDVARGVYFETIAINDGQQHDIMLSGLDISQWGTDDTTGFPAGVGSDGESAIGTTGQAAYVYGKNITRIGVRDCNITNPRYRSAVWFEHTDAHPSGPTGINFNNVGPVICIAENTIDGGGKMYNDVLGGHGLQFPLGEGNTWGIGSYIGRNYLKDTEDDAVEADGHGFLVIEQNWFDNFFNCMSSQPCGLGPLWLIGNISGRNSCQGDFGKFTNAKSTTLPYVISGRNFCVANTAIGGAQSVDNGFGKRGNTGTVYRNNIIITESTAPSFSILANQVKTDTTPGCSLVNSDYNMYYVIDIDRNLNGNPQTSDPNGIDMNTGGEPTFTDDDGTINGDYRITGASVGSGAGQEIPGITIAGDTTPDMGLGGLVTVMPLIGSL